VAAPLELARHLVLGAIDYARSLGFGPRPDFAPARPKLGDWEGPSALTFGKDGKPYYISGPHDDASRVIATLERTVGRDGYHFIVGLDELNEVA
jgi:hypothetical protein